MATLWGWEYLQPPPRKPEWYEALPGMIGAGGEALQGALQQQRLREQAQNQMTMQQRKMDLAAKQVAAREAATAEYRKAALGIQQGNLDVARAGASRQETAAEDLRRRALEGANVLAATEAEKMVPAAARDEPEVQPSMQALASVKSNLVARATGAVPQKVSIRESKPSPPPWLRVEGPTRPIVGRLDIPPGLAERLGGPTQRRSIVAQRPVPERVGDITEQIPGQMAAAQTRKQREYVGRHPTSSKDPQAQDAAKRYGQLRVLRDKLQMPITNPKDLIILGIDPSLPGSIAEKQSKRLGEVSAQMEDLGRRFPGAFAAEGTVAPNPPPQGPVPSAGSGPHRTAIKARAMEILKANPMMPPDQAVLQAWNELKR